MLLSNGTTTTSECERAKDASFRSIRTASESGYYRSVRVTQLQSCNDTYERVLVQNGPIEVCSWNSSTKMPLSEPALPAVDRHMRLMDLCRAMKSVGDCWTRNMWLVQFPCECICSYAAYAMYHLHSPHQFICTSCLFQQQFELLRTLHQVLDTVLVPPSVPYLSHLIWNALKIKRAYSLPSIFFKCSELVLPCEIIRSREDSTPGLKWMCLLRNSALYLSHASSSLSTR